MKDYVVRALAFNKTVKIFAASSTNLVEYARYIHGLWPTSAAALGRALTVAAMMSLNYKSNEHLTIKFECDGPIGQILIEATYGCVRGLVDNPEVFLQYNNGHLAVGKAVGNGYLHIIKDLNMRAPFSSSVKIQTGEIGDDFTYYFAESEQTPSSVGVGVLIETDNSCKAAGGFILQIMPGCTEETITKIEEILSNIKPVSQMIQEGYTPEMIIGELSQGEFEILEKNDISYQCPCSKERFERGIKSLGEKEITDIINEDEKASVTCRFCKKEYNFTKHDLEKLLKQIKEKK